MSAQEFDELRILVVRIDERVQGLTKSLDKHKAAHDKWLYFAVAQVAALVILFLK